MVNTFQHVKEALEQSGYVPIYSEHVKYLAGYHFKAWGYVQPDGAVDPCHTVYLARAELELAVVMTDAVTPPLIVKDMAEWEAVKELLFVEIPQPDAQPGPAIEPAVDAQPGPVIVKIEQVEDGMEGGPHPGVRALDPLPAPGGMPKPGPFTIKIEDEDDNDVVIVEPSGSRRKRPRTMVEAYPAEAGSAGPVVAEAFPVQEDKDDDVIYVKTYPARR
jgi:hypothetical protein